MPQIIYIYICISWFVVWATAEKEGVQWDLMQSSSRDQDRITQKLHHGPALNGVFIQQPLTQLTAQVPAWLTDRVVIRWDLHALLFSHLSCPNTQTLSSDSCTCTFIWNQSSKTSLWHTQTERERSVPWSTVLFQDQNNLVQELFNLLAVFARVDVPQGSGSLAWVL